MNFFHQPQDSSIFPEKILIKFNSVEWVITNRSILLSIQMLPSLVSSADIFHFHILPTSFITGRHYSNFQSIVCRLFFLFALSHEVYNFQEENWYKLSFLANDFIRIKNHLWKWPEADEDLKIVILNFEYWD